VKKNEGPLDTVVPRLFSIFCRQNECLEPGGYKEDQGRHPEGDHWSPKANGEGSHSSVPRKICAADFLKAATRPGRGKEVRAVAGGRKW